MVEDTRILAKAVARGWRRGQRFFPGDTLYFGPQEPIPDWAKPVAGPNKAAAAKAKNDSSQEQVPLSEASSATAGRKRRGRPPKQQTLDAEEAKP